MMLTLPQSFNLTGRVAIVTGGGGLLGTEHGHALAEIGATVVLADINEDAAQTAASAVNRNGYAGRAVAAHIDVTKEASIKTLSERVTREVGSVRILVNNAAIDSKVQADAMAETSRLEHFSLEQWHFQIEVGLTGAFLCSKVFGLQMATLGNGVILNIASDLSVFGPDQRLYRREGVPEDHQTVKPVTYSVIKTGLIGLSRYLATYWADQNVRSNALSPGGIFNGQDEEFVQRLSTLIPLKRMAERGEYRAAVQFLCSDASMYMTGQNIIMDGGRSAW
jgi:NAD(P)-dependent dehydrogenase (short-subunit alcohol dehydrogenase family)